MKAASIHDIKKELEQKTTAELLNFCLRLAKLKKENKELLGFLLFDADHLDDFTKSVKQETSDLFDEINTSNIYFIKKSMRKILRHINKYARFVASKPTEAELLTHFCNCINSYAIPVGKSRQLMNLYQTQQKKIDTIISSLHPDLQYDLKRLREWE